MEGDGRLNNERASHDLLIEVLIECVEAHLDVVDDVIE